MKYFYEIMLMCGLLIYMYWEIFLLNVENESVYWVFIIFDEWKSEREREGWVEFIIIEVCSLIRE